MKCEHEGCDKEAVIVIETLWLRKGQHRQTDACAEHAGPHLRELADEVEGVRECDTCGGRGSLPIYTEGCTDLRPCPKCDGERKVPR